MAYDELTTERFRMALGMLAPITEKRMMGGLCFLYHGHMIGGADMSKEGVRRFMFRLGKDNQELGLSLPGAEPLIQGGRTLRGMFFVDEAELDDEQLKLWVETATKHVLTLEPK